MLKHSSTKLFALTFAFFFVLIHRICYFLACHKACDGCLAYGNDKCEKCDEGYTKEDNSCIGKCTDLEGHRIRLEIS